MTVPSTDVVLVGVDAGATKTVALAVRPDGVVVGRSAGEGANPKRHGLEVAADRIARLALAAAGEGTRPALVYVAGAGLDLPEHARALEEALGRQLTDARVLAANDTLAVLRCGAPDGVGLAVPVSTGGNVIGRGPDGRVTDRGHGIFGGGYVLGALAARSAGRDGAPSEPAAGELAAVGSAACERRGRASGAARRAVPGGVSGERPAASVERARVSAELAAAVAAANLTWRGRRPEPEAAQLGAAVAAAAEAGDPYPLRIVGRWCARVTVAVRQEVVRLGLGPTPCVIVYGGLLETSPWLGGRIRSAVLAGAPGARLASLDGEPVEGAALLARDAWSGRLAAWDFVPRR